MNDSGAITPLSQAEQALLNATTPEQTKNVEALAAAAMAWAREQDDFENLVEAGRIYILARCKTTELISPTIRQGQYGREGNADIAFISDYGFTKMQWQRRRQELAVRAELDSYIDDCIEKQTAPTITGLIRFAGGSVQYGGDQAEWRCRMCGKTREEITR